MNYPPKLVPPLHLKLCLCLLIIPCLVSTLPTVPHNLRGNLLQNLDKSFFQPPALEETIHEVQKILNQDPSLPRLTRGEIEELYEKVTREEYEKSMKAGDKARADSMRALMLVLPYNTDNNTEDNLQELFTRPPVTKVVDSYSSHQPIQFLTPSMNSEGKFETKGIGQIDATTYKPSFHLKTQPIAYNPTTYHPSNPPPVLFRMTPSINEANFIPFKPLVTDLPLNYDYNLGKNQNSKPVQRFSSHYNAKNAEFLKITTDKKRSSTTSTIKPVADVLESLGIIAGHTQTHSRVGLEDYYAAESAPKPQVVSVADLKGLRSQSLGPTIKADAYSMFKPLNIGEEIRVKPEVEGYLTRFGIVGGRKRKAIKKNEASSSTQNSLEPLSQESEIATAKIPSNHRIKAKKGVTSVGNTELEKLLENLKELERLNVNTKVERTTAKPSTTSTTTTTTTTTTPAPTTISSSSSLITNGKPMLIEPKKPRRRIDPNIDINFANQGNHQTEPNQSDQLSKLLENLQELEKLKINPENVLKQATPVQKATNTAASRPVAVVTPAPIQTPALTHRFTMANLTPQQQLLLFQQQAQSGSTAPDFDQLQKVLQQLQVYEKANGKTTSTTTSTTKKPVQLSAQIGPTDLWQLRKLLTDDNELEKLFEQAKARQQQTKKSKTTTTSTTSTSTTTTKKPGPSVNDLLQLQKYLAELEKATSRATTTPKTTTTSTTSTTTTTTTTTPKPPMIPTYPTIEYESRPKKQTVDHGDLQALINRVQQLERINIQQRERELEKPLATDTPLSPFLGFTTRNVKAPSPKAEQDLRLPVNDFANLRTLYKQVEEAEKASHSDIEISTKATAAKAYQDRQYETATRRSQNFAQRIIDITNDTGSGSSLQEVDPNDFVQLQKLLSKVQELERVRINLPTPNPRAKSERGATKAPNLDTAASQRTQNVQNLNGAHIVYPAKENAHKEVEELLIKESDMEDLKLDLPAYNHTTEKPKSANNNLKQQSSSEELKDLVYAKPVAENDAYKNLQPPMIYKTVTKEPPRFVATKSPKEIKTQTDKQKIDDLEELQKLLNNAQELKKLGVALPKELTQQLETKFTQPEGGYTSFKKLPSPEQKAPKKGASGVEEYLQRFGLSNSEAMTTTTTTTFSPTTASSEEEEPSERTAVFSLTTIKSLIPKAPKTTTESSVELPVFSATKIIEAAIKRAANKIGVSTEHPHESPKAFRRRTDDDIEESQDDMDVGVATDQDLMTDFSEFNYQLALPDDKPLTAIQNQEDLRADLSEMNYEQMSPVYIPSTETKKKEEKTPIPDLTENVDELQRLIKNLQELKNLNLTPNDKALLRQADLKYLENLKKQQTSADDTIKTRRQSVTPSEATTLNAETTITTSAPENSTNDTNRIQLDLSLDDSDTDSAAEYGIISSTTAATSTSSTTEESRNGSLADLEDSFGPNPNTESPPPPKKKNGFYFLADWNSFLEVGDGDDQVVVRLSPKIGDPRLFLPVKIP